MTHMTGSKLSIFSHPGKITAYWITTRSFPYRGQYGCLFSRCRKYAINSLIHGHFHIGLVMITRTIWKCPCINLYVYLTQIINYCIPDTNSPVSSMCSLLQLFLSVSLLIFFGVDEAIFLFLLLKEMYII